jgi:hypothetical protein
MDTEKRIKDIIKEKGPLIGSELISHFKKDPPHGITDMPAVTCPPGANHRYKISSP